MNEWNDQNKYYFRSDLNNAIFPFLILVLHSTPLKSFTKFMRCYLEKYTTLLICMYLDSYCVTVRSQYIFFQKSFCTWIPYDYLSRLLWAPFQYIGSWPWWWLHDLGLHLFQMIKIKCVQFLLAPPTSGALVVIAV